MLVSVHVVRKVKLRRIACGSSRRRSEVTGLNDHHLAPDPAVDQRYVHAYKLPLDSSLLSEISSGDVECVAGEELISLWLSMSLHAMVECPLICVVSTEK